MEEDIGLTHDEYFKKQFKRKIFARCFFERYLPKAVREKTDWNSLKPVPGDFVDNVLGGRRTDIVYLGKITGKEEYYFIHLEHQRTSDKLMPLRMLGYTVRLWEQQIKQYPKKKLPWIYSLTVYQGKNKWNVPNRFRQYMNPPEYLRANCPEFSYDLMDLSELSDSAVQGEPFIRLALLAMKHIDSPKINELLEGRLLPLISEVLGIESGLEYVEELLYYLFKKGNHLDEEKTVKTLQRIPENTTVKETVMTLAEKWEQRGREEGREEGKNIIVSKMLQLKFNKNAEYFIERLNDVSPDQLDTIAERILTMDRIEDIFRF
jgi:predicted transposase/invertase (TIGR01784 family)